MNYVAGISKAIEYVENNLKENLGFEEIAKQAYFSSFHFQRMFSLLCGISLGDYIRARRLSSAGGEIVKTNRKIIDIALDYGYDSPESFTRAFTRFHGVTPTEARRTGKVKIFSRLFLKLSVSGGNVMDYRIVKLGETKILAKRKEFKKQQELTTVAISGFWKECNQNGTTKKLIGCIPKEPKLKGLLGVSFTGEGDAEKFPYGLAAEYDGSFPVPEGLEEIVLPASSYAVFPVKGKMPEAFIKTYTKICKEFFVQSGYEFKNTVEMEVYPSDDDENPDYYCEIWVAIK